MVNKLPLNRLYEVFYLRTLGAESFLVDRKVAPLEMTTHQAEIQHHA